MLTGWPCCSLYAMVPGSGCTASTTAPSVRCLPVVADRKSSIRLYATVAVTTMATSRTAPINAGTDLVRRCETE